VHTKKRRVAYSGTLWGLNGGNNIGCPPIMNFGNEKQKEKYLNKIARGDIRFCLGITEPDGENNPQLLLFSILMIINLQLGQMLQTSVQ
jgi:alkylation response protein AidB-like acyl-CoA dehydrogenase